MDKELVRTLMGLERGISKMVKLLEELNKKLDKQPSCKCSKKYK